MNINSIYFTIIVFPGGSKSIMRMGVFREVFDGEVENAEIVDYAIWNMPLSGQIKMIEDSMSKTEDNIILFVPGAKFKKYIPGELLLSLKNKYPDVPVLVYLLDGIEVVSSNL